jgi:type 1 fimbria pilin
MNAHGRLTVWGRESRQQGRRVQKSRHLFGELGSAIYWGIALLSIVAKGTSVLRALQGVLLSMLVATTPLGAVAEGGQRVRIAGDVYLEGHVVYATCAISAPETAQLISWQEGRITFTEWTDGKLFDIRLSECTSTVSQNVSVRFSGVEQDGTDDVGRSNEVEEGAWNWSDGRVVIQVAHDPTLLRFVDGPVFRFRSKFRFLVPMSSGAPVSVPVYFLVAYP